MEIIIVKEIEKNNDIHLTLYIDGKQNNTFYIGEDTDKGLLNTVIELYVATVKDLLRKDTIADKRFSKTSVDQK